MRRYFRRLMPLELLAGELAYSLRILRKNGGVTFVAVVMLALGIGANTAIFSVADPLLFRALPVRNPHDLVLFRMRVPNLPDIDYVPFLLFDQVRTEGRALTGIFATVAPPTHTLLTVEGESAAGRIRTEWVSGAYFETLGVDAVAGRVFLEQEDRASGEPVAVISHGLWQRRFAGTTQAIGQAVSLTIPALGYKSFTIIGVAPPNFHGVNVDFNTDVWLPLHHRPGFGGPGTESFGLLPVQMMGRLQSNSSLPQAQAELDVVYSQIASLLPDHYRTGAVHVDSGHSGFSVLRSEYRRPLLILAVATGIVLTIACTNVAALLLALGAARRKELGIRLAMGAVPSRVVGQLMTESLILAVLGGLLGVVVGGGAQLLVGYLPPESGFMPKVGADLRVLGFTSAVSFLSVLVFGLVPAMRATRLNLDSVLKGRTGTNGSSLMRWNRLILVGQVAFSLLLILGAGLFLRTFHNLRDLERGFGTEDTVQFAVRPRGDEFTADPGERFASGLANLPGIDAATNYFFRGPLVNRIRMTPIQVEGYVPAPHESLMASVWPVGPRFFETLAVSLHRGRDFREADLAREPDPFSKFKGDPVQTPDSESAVGVISRNMAEDLFGDRNPIGRKVRVGSTEIEVIGVAEDARYGLLVERPPWVLYRLNYTRAVYANLFAVRTKESLATLAPALQDLVDEINPGFYVTDLQSLGQLLESTLVRERFMARLASLFGLLALFMVSIGIYGQVAYGVAQRRSELGIRMALGAPAANVLALLAQEMFLVLATGILLGLLAALATTHLVSSLLFGLTPMDPSTIAFSITVLLTAALAASLRPALQAARTDPMVVLRHQ